jgi:hypothetical protein
MGDCGWVWGFRSKQKLGRVAPAAVGVGNGMLKIDFARKNQLEGVPCKFLWVRSTFLVLDYKFLCIFKFATNFGGF